MDFEDFDLDHLIVRLLKTFRGLSVRVQPNVPPAFRGDAPALAEIIFDLLAHAAKDNDGRSLELEIRAVDDSGRKIEFSVRGPAQDISFSVQFEMAQTFGGAAGHGYSYKYDDGQLDKLSGHLAGPQSLLETLCEDFLNDGKTLMAAVLAAADAEDFELVRSLAGALRSPAATLGMNSLADLCADLEECPPGSVDMKAQIMNLENCYQEACAWITHQTRSVRAS